MSATLKERSGFEELEAKKGLISFCYAIVFYLKARRANPQVKRSSSEALLE
jgi:hypothetical protein